MSAPISRRRLLALAAVTPIAARAANVRRLFDGKTFDGWTRAGGGVWTIEDGAFVGRFDRANPGAGYVMTVDEFLDFELRLDFWISKDGNSGVYVREPKQPWTQRGDQRPAHGDPAGYEVQINYAAADQPTGMVYGVQMPEKTVGGEEVWTGMTIACRGETMSISVDKQVVNVYKKTKVQRGVIGLQIHGGKPHDHIVRFRNIELES